MKWSSFFFSTLLITSSLVSGALREPKTLDDSSIHCPGSSFISTDNAHLSFQLESTSSCKTLKEKLLGEITKSSDHNLKKIHVKCAPFHFNYGNIPTLFYKTGTWNTDQPRPEEDVQFVVLRHRNDCTIESGEEIHSQNFPNAEYVLARSFSSLEMNVALTRVLWRLAKRIEGISDSGKLWLDRIK